MGARRIEGDAVVIRSIIEVLRQIASKLGENEWLNAVAHEAQILSVRGEALLAHANPHVKNPLELVGWAHDCADLVDYISAATLRH